MVLINNQIEEDKKDNFELGNINKYNFYYQGKNIIFSLVAILLLFGTTTSLLTIAENNIVNLVLLFFLRLIFYSIFFSKKIYVKKFAGVFFIIFFITKIIRILIALSVGISFDIRYDAFNIAITNTLNANILIVEFLMSALLIFSESVKTYMKTNESDIVIKEQI